MRRMDVDQPVRRATMLWGVAAVVAGLMIAACGSPQRPDPPSEPVPGQPVPASAIPRLTAMAGRAARAQGDRAPEWVSVVVTTHEKALTSATPGDFVPGSEHTIVYLVTMKGHFTAYNASPPSGARLPIGTYSSFVINTKTFQGMDGGLSDKPPPVAPASLGPVTYLKVGT
jgi:hypothetical protein